MKEIKTERLNIREITKEDSAFILELLNDPGWLKFIGDRGVYNLQDAENYILNGPVESYKKNNFGLYLTELRSSGTPIGICGLLKRDYLAYLDVGFAFLPEFRGKGFATEAARAVINEGIETLGIKKIAAITQSDNEGSIKVLKKLGLQFKKYIKLPDENKQLELYTMDL